MLRVPDRIVAADGSPVRAMDGDSLRIGDRIVRLRGIDAVELGQLCTLPDGSSWRCGVDARAALAELVAAGGLSCTAHEADRYGRAVARCSTAGTADLGAAMVARGWAVSDDPAHAAAQSRARAGALGIWRGRFDEPADWRAAHPRPLD